ncbi:MAG: hypothetical protein IJE22_05005 [Oscillibacter sp.]|nr:hypothetical protein [Oscillibacter sp.]MBQ2996575.1 hypothetical protein [Oscillibacter sp.]
MALFELKSVSEHHRIENAAADHRGARKIAQYRVSDKAVYFPAFPGDRYIPFAAVTKAISRNSGLPVKGTCGKAIPVVRVKLFYDGEFYQEFVVERAEQANAILDALAAARPDVDIDREVRKPEIF